MLGRGEYGIEERLVVLVPHPELPVVDGQPGEHLLSALLIVKPCDDAGEFSEDGYPRLRHPMRKERAHEGMAGEEPGEQVLHRGVWIGGQVLQQVPDRPPVEIGGNGLRRYLGRRQQCRAFGWGESSRNGGCGKGNGD